jgi:hypothetical protein
VSCRIHQINKKTNVTYVYESVSFWDKEKKQARNKKICVGKLDPSGVFVASKRFTQEQKILIDADITATAQVIGPSIILDAITERLGLERLLKSCFAETYQQILMMAYYLVADGGALSHCEAWCKSHAPQMAQFFTSQRIS